MSSEARRGLRIALCFTAAFVLAELLLATVVLLAAWPFAARVAAGGPGAGLATKSLNVLAILKGEGFSVFYQDADDRVWTRLAGVTLGLGYVALVIAFNRWASTRRSASPLRAA